MQFHLYLAAFAASVLALLVSSSSPTSASPEGATGEKSAQPVFLTREGTEILLDGKPFRAVGVNKFDLAMQYIAGGSERDKAAQAIKEAADHGFRVIRFLASGFYPKQMQLWSAHDAYWGRMDDLIATARDAGVWLIPTVMWNHFLFPDMAGETMQDMLTNKDSRSRQYLELYTHQLVTRYKDEPTILFWELTNELNLSADIESVHPLGFSSLNAVDQGAPLVRVRRDHYTSEQMIPFMKEMAQFIRERDRNHLIGSGYSAPRPAAQHLRKSPQKGDWTQDSPEEAEIYIRDTHPDPIDLISIHFYSQHDNIRFGSTDKNSAVVLRKLKEICDRVGKPVYLGETGAENDDPDAMKFVQNTFDEAIAADYPIILMWVWKVPGREHNIDPETHPEMIKLMQKAGEELSKQAGKK